MYKILTICILVALVYCQSGHYFVMLLVQKQHKQAMKQKLISRLKDEDLEMIAYTGNEAVIHWEEDGKEFFYKGELYDVVHKSSGNGIIWLHCLNDVKEKKMMDEYKAATKKNTSGKRNKSVNPSIILFYVSGEFLETFHYAFKTVFPSFCNSLPSVTINIVSPPPRCGSFIS